MFALLLVSCTASVSVDITKHTQESNTTESIPCNITINEQFDIEAPYVEITIDSADKIILELHLYEEREVIQREKLLPTTEENTLEMFWPIQTQNHTWQEMYGTQATLTAIGYSGEAETCRESFAADFSQMNERIQSSRFITNPYWNVETAEATGLHVSVPALHESDKYALVSTPLSHTLLSIIGPFDRDEGFRDITNLTILESQEGTLLSLVAQDSWPGFEEQEFLIHNAITGTQKEQWTLESSIHHTMSAKENSDGSLDVLTSTWDERFGISAGYYSHPTRMELSESVAIPTALIQVDSFYPESQSSPVTYNNFVWSAGPNSDHIVSIIFSNQAMALPSPEENSSSVLLLDEATGEQIWFSNPNNTHLVHEQSALVVGLDTISEQELALTFPHAAQFDGDVLYVQDHMDVESGSKQARINAFTKDGSFLWSYAIPSSLETTNNARRRHGGMWSIQSDGNTAVCAFFVDTQTIHCVDKLGTEVGWLAKYELSENQADKWHTVDYLTNWKNTITP